jgi:hypothetical protein
MGTPKNVGVVSLLGDQFHGVYVGFTVFGNTNFEADVADWAIDRYAEELLAAHLREKHSVNATPLAVDAAARRRYFESPPSLLKGPDLDAIYAAAKEQGFDTIAFVLGGSNGNNRFHKPGYGFYARSALGGTPRCVYTAFIVTINSVETRNQSDQAAPICAFGERELEWKDKFEDYSAQEQALMRRKVEASLKAELPASASEAYSWATR